MAHDEEQERAFGGQTKTGGLSQIHPYMGGGAPPGICRVRRRIGGCGVKLQRLKGKGDIPSPRAAVIYSDDAV